MKKHKLYCNPKDGKFNWEKQFDLTNLPAKLAKYGRVVVEFKKYTPMKSLSQLGYYRAGILPYLEKELMENTGVNQSGWHEVLKERCGPKAFISDTDMEYTKSQADYTEKEMAEFITKVQQWVLEWFGLMIPPPTAIGDYLDG